MPPPSLAVGDSEDDSDSDVGIQTLDVLPQASCRPRGSRAPGPSTAHAAAALLATEAVPSEDAGFLSHVHTDRPLGRPRGPLLQQHVGLLVVQRRLQPLPSSTLFCLQLLPPAVDYLKA